MRNAWENIEFDNDIVNSRIEQRRYVLIDFLNLQNKFLKDKSNSILELKFTNVSNTSFKVYVANSIQLEFICMIDILDSKTTEYEFFNSKFEQTNCKNLDLLQEEFFEVISSIGAKIIGLYNQVK